MNEQKKMVIFVILILIGLKACDLPEDDTDDDADMSADQNTALVVTTDFSTGSYSTVGVQGYGINSSINTIHSDTTCRFDPILKTWFLVSRLGADSINVLDGANGFTIVNEYSVEAGSNPQDIISVSLERAFISRYDVAEMLVVHPLSGEVTQRIDLAPFADADGIPEVSSLYQAGGKVFAAVQRLDRNQYFEPTDSSLLLVLDGETGEVEDSLTLGATNPYGKLRYCDALNRLVIVETGSFMSLDDGGIEYLDLSTQTLSGLVVREAALGGNLVDAVIATPTKGFAIVGVVGDNAAATHLVSFDPSTGTKLSDLLVSDQWVYGFLELTPNRDELWVSDQTSTDPGIRIFDVTTDQEKTAEPINVGLPPASICFAE